MASARKRGLCLRKRRNFNLAKQRAQHEKPETALWGESLGCLEAFRGWGSGSSGCSAIREKMDLSVETLQLHASYAIAGVSVHSLSVLRTVSAHRREAPAPEEIARSSEMPLDAECRTRSAASKLSNCSSCTGAAAFGESPCHDMLQAM